MIITDEMTESAIGAITSTLDRFRLQKEDYVELIHKGFEIVVEKVGAGWSARQRDLNRERAVVVGTEYTSEKQATEAAVRTVDAIVSSRESYA